MKLLLDRFLMLLVLVIGACSPPPDNYHYVQTRSLAEEAQFERDEALQREEEIISNNDLLRGITAKLKQATTARALPKTAELHR